MQLRRVAYGLAGGEGGSLPEAPGAMPSQPYYFFSISQATRAFEPWRPGVVYILPGASFVHQAPILTEGLTVHVAQSASLTPVAPLARLAVQPADFPFLAAVRSHDDAVVAVRAQANPDGFPWLDEEA